MENVSKDRQLAYPPAPWGDGIGDPVAKEQRLRAAGKLQVLIKHTGLTPEQADWAYFEIARGIGDADVDYLNSIDPIPAPNPTPSPDDGCPECKANGDDGCPRCKGDNREKPPTEIKDIWGPNFDCGSAWVGWAIYSVWGTALCGAVGIGATPAAGVICAGALQVGGNYVPWNNVC